MNRSRTEDKEPATTCASDNEKLKTPKGGKLVAIVTLALLCACASVKAQMVPVWPTNYTMTILRQNDEGRLFRSWRNASMDTFDLSGRRLVVRHVTYTDGVYFMGSKGGGPRMLEETHTYSQVGANTYRSLGGHKIRFFAERVKGGWVANTNPIPPHVETFYWWPSAVGRVAVTDGLSRTIITASPLECYCRNLAGSTPYLVTFRCTSGATSFKYQFRLERDQRKFITLGMGEANSLINGPRIDFFEFDMDAITEDPLPW